MGPLRPTPTTVRRSAPHSVNPPSPTSSTGTVAVVLAAGLGTRMRSTTPKVLHELCGRPMLAYVLDAWESTAGEAAGGRPVIVYSPAVEAIVAVFTERGSIPRGVRKYSFRSGVTVPCPGCRGLGCASGKIMRVWRS